MGKQSLTQVILWQNSKRANWFLLLEERIGTPHQKY
jgi:hypothetical protein